MRDRLLDAAAERIARYGIRKTTLDDIVRTAGCSRPTLYKYFRGKDSILAALIERETERYYQALHEAVGSANPSTSSLEKAFIFAIRSFRDHPVVQGVLSAEPESFVRMLQQSGPDLFRVATEFAAPLIDRQIASGKFRRVDSRLVAEAMLRLTLSFVLLPGIGVDTDDDKIRALVRETMFKGVLRRVDRK
jgi:AcrR family transcriptional regulator